MTDRPLLILDLDETLIHASAVELDRPADFRVFSYHVYRRPGLDEFLQACSELYELAVWSSASDDYVSKVVEQIFPDHIDLHFVWGRSRATYRRSIADEWPIVSYDPDHYHFIKQLKKVKRLGWKLERTLIVDDTPAKCIKNFGNAIYIREFEGALDDGELSLLSEYLSNISHRSNFRRFEKRMWRSETLEATKK